MKTLFLHGFTGGRGSFAHLDLDAEVPDLPGHGDEPDASTWDAAVEGLLPRLGDEPATLGGYSMGARLALALAVRHPARVARLVLISGTAGLSGEKERAARRAEDEELASLLDREGLAPFLARWEAHPTLASLRDLPVRLQLALRSERLRHRPGGLASALRGLGTGAMPPLWRELRRLEVPALIVAGARDAKFAELAVRMADLLPQPRLQVLDCGHAPHLEKPDEFLAALRSFEELRR